jgi:hypothetical protein
MEAVLALRDVHNIYESQSISQKDLSEMLRRPSGELCVCYLQVQSSPQATSRLIRSRSIWHVLKG